MTDAYLNIFLSEKYRFDYILIWGHGLIFREEIINLIRAESNFKIELFVSYKPKNIKKFVKEIYSYDYAPFEHLASKTKYLLSTPAEVFFIFFKNINPDIDYYGEGRYRHSESPIIKQFKENLRDRFNPRNKDNKRSEDHVIHASDNQSQTDKILKYLGYKEGITTFSSKKFLGLPYYINHSRKIKIQIININDLYCNVVTGDRYSFSIGIASIEQSPHFRGLSKDIRIYEEYINKYLGTALKMDYSSEKFKRLAESFDYCDNDNHDKYIVVKNYNPGFLILDGLHRASILKYRNNYQAKVMIIE